MEWLALAVAQISFSDRELREEDAQAIESLLRNYEDIDNLSVHNRRVTFYLWGQQEVEYTMLDHIREELKKRHFPNFVISATEYMETGKKYYYAAKNVMQKSRSSLE
jgi:hypothetical protein